MITDSLVKVFRSERLIYRAFQNDEKDKAFCYEQITSDPVNYALSDPGLLAPRSRQAEDAMTDDLAKSLLAVVLCLPADESSTEDQSSTDEKAVKDPQKAEPIPIGFMCLNWGGFGPKYLHHHRSTELGITIAAPYQGKGYGSEALKWVLDWSFRFANMHSVTLGCVEYNTRGQKVYEKAGFVLEGRRRQVHFYDRKWWDVLLYSVLESEWEQRQVEQDEKQ